ncbi:ABC transporter substrate-binding protein [Thermotoga profunda]|uniref:ABC transporter substrate-binding protein n=1 Tax=Thermotoga profunda TaxID=1508420 RepID=UPI000597A3DD|nr:ABC transporter substrate-binding protein [Thermotoga profunda]
MGKKLLVLVFLVACTLLLIAAQTPKKGGTLVIAYWGDPISFNPNAKTDDAGNGIYGCIFSKLVALDADYNVIPDLAESWEVSSDGLTYTFHLRKGVKWHDGVPCTAEDAVWTYSQIKSRPEATASKYFEKVVSIEAKDDYTVVFKMSQPQAAFLGFLAWYGTWVMPKHIYDITKDGSPVDWMDNPATQKPVGTGPFKFVEWVKGSHVTLQKNPDYFMGEPYLDRIIFKIIPDQDTAQQALLSGEVDVNSNVSVVHIPIYQKMPDLVVFQKPAPSRYYMGFNVARRSSPFNNPKVRFAAAYALNRQEIFDKAIKYGSVSDGFYTIGIPWAYNPNTKAPSQDLKMAEKLLDEAGYPRGKDGYRFEVTLVYFQGQVWRDMATIIKEQLDKVGIKVKLEEYEIAAYIEKCLKAGDFDLTVLNGFQGPDPDNLKLRVGTGGDINVMGYSSKEVDELLDEGATAVDQNKRKEYYFKIQEILAQDLPFYPIGEVAINYVHKKYVKDMPYQLIGKIALNNYAKTWLDK